MLMDRLIHLARWAQFAAFAGLFLLGILAPRMWRGREVSWGPSVASSSMGGRQLHEADPLRRQDQTVQHAVPSLVQPAHQHEAAVAARVILEGGQESPGVLRSLYLAELGTAVADWRPGDLALDPEKISFEVLPRVTHNSVVQPRELRINRVVVPFIMVWNQLMSALLNWLKKIRISKQQRSIWSRPNG